MILFEGVDLDALLLTFDQILDDADILAPISALLATFFKLEQHLIGSLIILDKYRGTCVQRRQMLMLNLISTSLHSSSNSSESSIKCFSLSFSF